MNHFVLFQILRYFMDCSFMHCMNAPLDWSNWNVFYPSDFPRQTNGYDCGVIVCQFVYSIMTGKSLRNTDFRPPKTVQMRKWCCNFILGQSTEKVTTNGNGKERYAYFILPHQNFRCVKPPLPIHTHRSST